ncbi:Tim44 domain-containing protein [Legionella hackeliae]|uniref:Import inner membrane translocase subunit Tim44 n=1 Tax=Legionella hackeliae TaxID=449 RepID=A0A0A8UQF3_LEGHA|nr:Tim44-like domain-containing protein [Legionella hackeliae]KTD09702.1 transmembrane protein [Legionella hackeliae]CEK10973.1 Import inner membrane translocase subunit Tim44 [Legionella hackeliae]STX47713.1 transmembrane protein [Legionella hackeliae]
MRTLILSLLIGLLSFGLVVNEAAAKRFGGGRSFGVQRSYNSLFSSKPKPNTIGQQTNRSRWGGMLGGLLAGGLLASLFMGNGLGSGLLSWLIVGAVLLFIINIYRRRIQPGFQTANASRPSAYNWQSNSMNYQATGNYHMNSAGFSEEDFLREAKVKFIRLQTAYDQKNLQDLQEFTAPEVFAEIKMQLDERGNESNKTEVINLNAQLLDVSEQGDSTIASVRFTGSIKENDDPVSTLDEIWHFRKFYGTNAWVVGGLQQEASQPM